MGATFSQLEAEKKTWISHDINFDEHVREANLTFLPLSPFKLKKKVYLGYESKTFAGLNYQHWFITDEKRQYFLEFGALDGSIYHARVHISTLPRNTVIQGDGKSKAVDEAFLARISHVLGMSNYSLCLRNCEHVANYIFRGKWISSQMNEDGALMDYFRKNILADTLRKINTFPSTIRPHIFKSGPREKVYSFIDDHYIATHFDYYLDHQQNTYNVLVVGPTGAGKSHLINVMFNEQVCDSEVSHHSVTKEMYFIRGKGKIFDFNENVFQDRDIVVADTVGLCDTEWDDEKIIKLIKGRVSANFKAVDAVFIVFRADRLQKEHVTNIKIIMDWLAYKKDNNHLKFMFVGTFAENLDEERKKQLHEEAKAIFELGDTSRAKDDKDKIALDIADNFDSLVYTGFPPEESLSESAKKRVVNSWNLLQPLLLLKPGGEQSLNVPDVHLMESRQSYMMRLRSSTRISIPKLPGCSIL